MLKLPVISLAKLRDPLTCEPESKRLFQACLQSGFFYLSDHQVPMEIVERAIVASKTFFQLPVEVKTRYSHSFQKVYPSSSRGYAPLFGETLHEDAGPDPKEIFDFGREQAPSTKPFTGPNIVPDDSVAPDFTASHYALQEQIMTQVLPHLLRGLAMALDLDSDWFDPYFQDLILIHRTIYYPPNTGSAGRHTDNGILTVLIQEYFPEPSLRVHTNDTWIDAACLKDTFVINLGDMLQLWTNNRFVSTPHEVIHRLPQSRVSIPFFVYPNVDAVIVPIGSKGPGTRAIDIMLNNFESIWVTKVGAGRAKELR